MAPEIFEWHPTKLLRDHDTIPDFALLILNQPLKNGANLRRLWRNSAIRVAADGGANRLHELSSIQAKFSNLQLIIGDLDSLNPTVRDFYVSQANPATVVHDPDQESTDFEKAVKWLRKTYPEGIDVVAMGGIGGRVDAGIRQLHELYILQNDAAYESGRVFLLTPSGMTFLLKKGQHRIHVNEDGESNMFGKYVGIIPLAEPSRISTKGLQWDVSDWETKIGGNLSTNNHVKPDTAVIDVETTADVLFTITLSSVDGEDEAGTTG